MTKRGWTAVAAAYVASVVFSFGAMNATDRIEVVKGEKGSYRDRRVSSAWMSLIPGMNVVVTVTYTAFLADGWTWDRSEPVKEPQPHGILEVDCSKAPPWCGWEGITCTCVGGKP